MFNIGDICRTVSLRADGRLRGTNWAANCQVTITRIDDLIEVELNRHIQCYLVTLISGTNRWDENLEAGETQYLYEDNLILDKKREPNITGFSKFQKKIANA